MPISVGSAPGRLDLLGGVADYSGALVLETPTRLTTTVTAEPADAFEVGPVRLSAREVEALARRPYPEVRRALAGHPRWTHYLVGVAVVLVRHGVVAAPTVRLSVASEVPQSVGVSSSAALEVATARALGAGDDDPLALARLCQEAENHVVGAPCGIMDQVTVASGTVGTVLPILCRPASVGAPYRRARTAAFMGKRIVEDATGRTWDWVSELPVEETTRLPERLDGASFLDRWGGTDDPVTTVVPEDRYPVRAAASFGAAEHARAERALAVLAAGDGDGAGDQRGGGRGDDAGGVGALGSLMAASHAGYDAMGLGHPASTALVHELLAGPGVHGARSSGGGCGGTVVVVCDAGALDDRRDLIR